jgi:hypothetical protein
MPDVLFCSWNRKAFTEASFSALRDNTNWDLAGRLFIHDDGSDGRHRRMAPGTPATSRPKSRSAGERRGGPVAAMNWYLDLIWPGFGAFVKIDNDYVVCPGWLDEIKRVADENMGRRRDRVRAAVRPVRRAARAARARPGSVHRRHRPDPSPHLRGLPAGLGWPAGLVGVPGPPRGDPKGWVRPDLPMFELDRLPMEPWASL